MEHSFRLEIHFHQEDQASVFLENNAIEDDYKKSGELLLYAYYVTRQLVNLGRNEVSLGIATLLTGLQNQMAQAAYHKSPNGPALVDYKGSPGRKNFLANLSWGDGKFWFDLKQNGFGWFGRGIGYYCPQSILILLQYLARRRIEDLDYIAYLEQLSYSCGGVFLAGELGMTNSHLFCQSVYHNQIKKVYQVV